MGKVGKMGRVSLRLRLAKLEDARMFWEWVNDPAVRRASFSGEHVAWDEHLEWFCRRLRDEACIMFVVEDAEGVPVGQVRFDIDERQEAEVDVSVIRERRGQGYGSAAITAAVEELLRRKPVRRINAYIKSTNVASVRAFENAGFARAGTVVVRGQPALHYVRDRG